VAGKEQCDSEGTNPNLEAAGINGTLPCPWTVAVMIMKHSRKTACLRSFAMAALIDNSDTRKLRENKCASRRTNKKHVALYVEDIQALWGEGQILGCTRRTIDQGFDKQRQTTA
jgi:hypothetical protein